MTLGVSTGWIIRSSLAKRGVKVMTGVTYQRIDDEGLHVLIEDVPRAIAVDTVVICAGQESNRSLFETLLMRGVETHIIGGAKLAADVLLAETTGRARAHGRILT